MNWYVHYTANLNLTKVSMMEGKSTVPDKRKCVEGPYSQDQALDRRCELARNFPDAYLSEKAKADEVPASKAS